jgi:hypothetical protein
LAANSLRRFVDPSCCTHKTRLIGSFVLTVSRAIGAGGGQIQLATCGDRTAAAQSHFVDHGIPRCQRFNYLFLAFGEGRIIGGFSQGPFRYDCAELITRNKANLNNFWLGNESRKESDNLPSHILASKSVEELCVIELELFCHSWCFLPRSLDNFHDRTEASRSSQKFAMSMHG